MITFTPTVDLGQVFILGLISIVAYFVKKTIDEFKERLDEHDKVLFKIVQDMGELRGVTFRRGHQ